ILTLVPMIRPCNAPVHASAMYPFAPAPWARIALSVEQLPIHMIRNERSQLEKQLFEQQDIHLVVFDHFLAYALCILIITKTLQPPLRINLLLLPESKVPAQIVQPITVQIETLLRNLLRVDLDNRRKGVEPMLEHSSFGPTNVKIISVVGDDD